MPRGWAWLREGLQLWRRNPALLTFATFGYLLSIIVISLVPLLGQLVASLLMPALSVGVLNACRAIDGGRKTGPDVLFSGFKANLQGAGGGRRALPRRHPGGADAGDAGRRRQPGRGDARRGHGRAGRGRLLARFHPGGRPGAERRR
jgi:hypothetical protein